MGNGLESSLKSAPAAAAPAADDDDDDDDDFFASSDDEDEDAKKAAEALEAKRVAEYNARKAAKEDKKGKVIAKSSITFDIKPWDDETNLDEIEAMCRKIEKDGLLWGSAKKKLSPTVSSNFQSPRSSKM